eukprot:TRINITY_DN3484_c0_g1_i1.p1 TRINITY_DN3484_c0_g1~~TRINITY_DN3484_c0_g1_i1.p1  ORF type:complete len:459 (-),score=99.07 TRINITY_DN3484_c0_g1_i1:59-1435(-)
MGDYTERIKTYVDSALNFSSLGIGHRKQGKVRDIYDVDKYLLLVTTDRVSAFDRVLADVPLKGQVLNQVSAWWFEQTKHIIPNHVVAVPDPNIVLSKKCKVFPIEFVVRGYITGTTSTSMWTNYAKGMRSYCGHELPDGLVQNSKLEKNLVTPTTKDDFHDRLISPEEIMNEGWMTKEEWEYCSQKALELFAFGQAEAAKRGLILVDTKYEMGVQQTENGPVITLVDEIHTPDSSRYWIQDTYQQRLAAGQAPDNIDKDILRRWYNEHCDPYKDEVLPKAPTELIVTLAQRYIQLFELITGETFKFPSPEDTDLNKRMDKNLRASIIGDLYENSKKVHIFFDSGVGPKAVEETTKAFSETGCSYEIFFGSEDPKDLLDALSKSEQELVEKNIRVVNVVRSASSLGSFVATNQKFPTIFCPILDRNATLECLTEHGSVPLVISLDVTGCAACAAKILNL